MQISDGLLWKASRDTLYRLLQLCISQRNLDIGQQVHISMVCKGLDMVPILKDHILRLYTSCGSLQEAQSLFDSSDPNLFAYNAAMSAYAKHGWAEMSFQLLQRLLQSGLNPDKCTFLCVLGVCCKTGDWKQGRKMHDWIIQDNLVQNVAKIQENLDVAMSQETSIENATTTQTNSWKNATRIQDKFGLNVAKFQENAGQNIPRMEKNSGQTKVEENLGENDEGNLVLDVGITNTIIDMYAKCGCLCDAHHMFDRFAARNAVTWAAIISGFSQHGESHFVMKLFEDMQLHPAQPNAVVFSCALKACCSLGILGNVQRVHDCVVRARQETDGAVVTALVDAYAKCKRLDDAWKVFDESRTSNVITWNAMIMGLAQHGDDLSSLVLLERLLRKGIEPDNATFLSVLKACAIKGNLEGGQTTHHAIISTGVRHEVSLENSLIDMYGKCGCMRDAQQIFYKLPNPDVISWGAVIDGYAENDQGFLALRMFEVMQQRQIIPNEIIFISALKACIGIRSTAQGRRMHDQVMKSGLEGRMLVGSAIIDMYAKCGNVEEASDCFEKQIDSDVVSWGAVIHGYVEIGDDDVAFEMFVEMLQDGVEATEAVFVTILKACMNRNAVELGDLVHEYIVKRGVQIDGPIANVLVDMYCRCGSLEDAHRVFEAKTNREVLMWGAIIAGFVQQGHFLAALELFARMQSQRIPPNRPILLSVLKAYGRSGTIEHAKSLHKRIVETGLDSDVGIANALVDLYTRCASRSEAYRVLSGMKNRDMVSWTASISHDVGHEEGIEAMEEDGVELDGEFCINFLAACCHEGKVETGAAFFGSMANELRIVPDFRHFHALANLFVQSGLFGEANDVLGSMPECRRIVGWTSVLSGCKRYGNAEVGQACFGSIAAPKGTIDVWKTRG